MTPLINAVKELDVKNTDQQVLIEQLQKQLADIQAQIIQLIKLQK